MGGELMTEKPMDTNHMQASIAHLLGESSKCLALFLEKVLPPRYKRAPAYEYMGQKSRARAEFEKLYAEAQDYEAFAFCSTWHLFSVSG